MTDSLELWLASGQTVIHNSLLHHYATIGLDETELIFIIQMQSYLDQSVFFPIPGMYSPIVFCDAL